MKALKKTIVEFLLLGVVGLVVGFTANGLRTKNSLNVKKNYFDVGSVTIPENTLTSSDLPTTAPLASATKTATGKTNKATTVLPVHPKHPYQEITLDEVSALLDDPDTATGLYVFVDARNDEQYNEGHIPGALQCDPYDIGSYIDAILPNVQGAAKIVVYCGGGECEDSIFMCRELVELDIPTEAIYLFAGGWNEWTKNGGQVEKGDDE